MKQRYSIATLRSAASKMEVRAATHLTKAAVYAADEEPEQAARWRKIARRIAREANRMHECADRFEREIEELM